MKRFYFLTALAFSLFCTSCTPHDSIDDFVTEYFVEELNTWDFTVRDAVNALLKELEIDQSDPTVSKVLDLLEGHLNREIRGVALSYRTFDPFGDPVLGTGAFFYPRNLE